MKFERQTRYTIVAEAGCKDRNWMLSGKVWVSQKKIDESRFQTDHLDITCELTQSGKTTRQVTVARNRTDKPLTLEQVSTAYISGIGLDGLRPWYDEERFRIHFCFACWHGEGQWRSGTLSEFGLYRTTLHNPANAVKLSSIGNMSTSLHYPLLYLEDCELGKTWFFEILTSGNWYMELGANEDGGLYVEMNGAWNGHDGWRKILQPEESYTTVPAIFGTVDGGVEDAIRERLRYHRSTSRTPDILPPVCFNDFMNCLWAMPSREKLLPLIDAAADAGCEAFCIDDGWFLDGLGQWQPNNAKFGADGLQGILDTIAARGMRPGLWLEIESISEGNPISETMRDNLLTRGGTALGCLGRFQFDFRRKSVRDYLETVFDRLYAMGVRYIKNDFNQTAGFGCDGADSASEGLRQTTEAFYGFIDHIREKYPDLLIENCGSGAMRTDHGIMPHFHLCSTSDQEFFWNNPSILSGTMACIAPEKCGAWAYPYPQLFDGRMQPAEEYFDEARRAHYADGEETVFNLVTGMLGVLYFSGHIEQADEKNRALIQEAVTTYKQNRVFLTQAYPIYPCGFRQISKSGMYAFGLSDGERTLLAVWRIGSEADAITVDLRKYLKSDAQAEILYPKELPTKYQLCNRKLTVRLDAPYSARLFKLLPAEVADKQ